jgi:hypothetical protein
MDRMDLEEEEEDSGRMDSASASTSLSPSPERQPPPHRFIIDIIYLVIGVDEQSESSLMNPLMVFKPYK